MPTNLKRVLRLPDNLGGTLMAFAVFIAVAGMYGLVVEFGGDGHTLISAALVVSIMHFWYDGFVWSVRKQHI